MRHAIASHGNDAADVCVGKTEGSVRYCLTLGRHGPTWVGLSAELAPRLAAEPWRFLRGGIAGGDLLRCTSSSDCRLVSVVGTGTSRWIVRTSINGESALYSYPPMHEPRAQATMGMRWGNLRLIFKG